MGCDIHLHIEIKIDGRWHHYAAPGIERNYALFEKLAGVRGEVENAIVAPRGLPCDATELTKLDASYWEEDGHTTSWLGMAEIAKLNNWLRTRGAWLKYDLEHAILRTYLGGSSFTGWKDYPEDPNVYGTEDVRFIFWFDN